MKINLNQVIKKPKKTHKEKDDPFLKPGSTEPFCLRDAIIQALLSWDPNDRSVTGDDKDKQFKLYRKVLDNPDEVDFTSEEIVRLKELIGKGYGPLIVGQTWEMLEGKE